MNKIPTVVDLFCGCGGFGLGAELAGFSTIAAIDIDSTLQSSYRLNFPTTKTVTADLSTMNVTSWKDILGNKEVDGVIGGPPCQGYSRMGVGDINDPRRKLLEDFFRHVNIIKPKFFVMENVEGLIDKKNRPQLDHAISTVDSCYTVLDPIIIDASNCGAPTKRKRVIVVGFDASRMKNLSIKQFQFNLPHTTVADAIMDLPKPINQSKNKNDFGYAKYPTIESLSKYAKTMRKPAPLNLGMPDAIKAHQAGNISGLFNTIHKSEVKSRYASLPQGSVDSVSRSKKLEWNGFCPTLRAGTGSDKGSYQAVRPIHPDEGRVITVREAARLQGFPDWFVFHPTKWHSFRMIGNSVSPLVSQNILKIIYSHLLIN